MDQEMITYGASCCWFSGDWAHVSNFVAICICGWSAGSFNQGVHLSRRSVFDQHHFAGALDSHGEVMLVDAQLTKTSAEKVLQQIEETKKPLSTIYITHAHADHFLGLEVFKEAYPGVRIIATSAVVDRINIVYQEKIDKWKKILGTGATSHAVAIEK